MNENFDLNGELKKLNDKVKDLEEMIQTSENNKKSYNKQKFRPLIITLYGSFVNLLFYYIFWYLPASKGFEPDENFIKAMFQTMASFEGLFLVGSSYIFLNNKKKYDELTIELDSLNKRKEDILLYLQNYGMDINKDIKR